ncbi:ABC transporter permease [Flexivirga sp. ID2601S]|uniref:ABC transporter permease n=1 Tax=Flexivirga aerilata TaxID=1656889 RepID=A0A849AK50_9MICO|nr:ABC transporter permease [Flexivirga aerilata]NNG40403.1 ABC transporter permease [Flexivirga aerilata]
MNLLPALHTARRIERATDSSGRLPNTLAIVAFSVATAALLIALAGVHAFQVRDATQPTDVSYTYVGLAACAAGLLAAPVLTLGGVAARLTVGRRDHRLATLRLAGATRTQVVVITLAESGRLALVGSLIGIVLYAVSLAPLSTLHFGGKPFSYGELVVPLWWFPLVVLGVTLLAVGSGAIGLRRVAISPLGVTARHTPRGLSVVRLLVTALVAVTWIAIGTALQEADIVVLMLIVAVMVAVANVVGPFVLGLAGRVIARTARHAPTLLAARRIVDDPKNAWRAVGSMGLAITVAGVGGSMGSIDSSGMDRSQQLIAQDMRTGSLLTVGIIAVIAATSTCVVQAARVVDRRGELRALSRSGAQGQTLIAAALRETSLPLAITVVLSTGFTMVMMAPFARYLSPATGAWIVVAVVASVALMLGTVRLTRPLIRQAVAEV